MFSVDAVIQHLNWLKELLLIYTLSIQFNREKKTLHKGPNKSECENSQADSSFLAWNANKRHLHIHVNCFQLSLTAGEDVGIEYEVDGWYYVSTHLTIFFTCSFDVNENILKSVIVAICSGEEKETWKGWKDSRSGPCSVCELMIADLVTYYGKVVGNGLENGTRGSIFMRSSLPF